MPAYQLCSPCACRVCCCACASRRACRSCALNLSLGSLCSCRSTHFVGGVCRSTQGASVVASASPPPPGAVTALQTPRKSPHRPAAKGQPRPESNPASNQKPACGGARAISYAFRSKSHCDQRSSSRVTRDAQSAGACGRRASERRAACYSTCVGHSLHTTAVFVLRPGHPDLVEQRE